MADSASSQPFGNLAANVQSGVGVAQALSNLEANREQAKRLAEQHEVSKFNWLSNQLGSALGASGPVRKLQLKRLQASAAQIGLNWDPANSELLMDEDFARTVQQGILKLNSLPDDQKSQAAASVFAMTGDVGAFGKGVADLGAAMRQQAALAAQSAGQGMIEPGKQLTQLLDVEGKLNTVHAKDVEALNAANKAQELLSRPGSQIDEQTANVLITKLQDPGSVAREMEVKGVSKAAAQGLINSAIQSLRAWSGGSRLMDADRQRLLSLIDSLAEPHAQAIERTKAGWSPYLKQAGINPVHAFATLPTYRPLGAKSGATAAAPEANDQLAPQWAALPEAEKAKIRKAQPGLAAAYDAISNTKPAEPPKGAQGVADVR